VLPTEVSLAINPTFFSDNGQYELLTVLAISGRAQRDPLHWRVRHQPPPAL